MIVLLVRNFILPTISERCFRDAGNDACRSCLVMEQVCNLKPRKHAHIYPFEQPVHTGNMSKSYYRFHPSIPANHPHHGRTFQGSLVTNTIITPFQRSFSFDSRQHRSAKVQESDEHDKYKLPKASYAPPPDALAFSSPPKIASVPVQPIQNQNKAKNSIPGEHSIVYQGSAPIKGTKSPSMQIQIPANSSEERRQGSKRIVDDKNVARSRFGPFTVHSNGNTPFKAIEPFDMASQDRWQWASQSGAGASIHYQQQGHTQPVAMHAQASSSTTDLGQVSDEPTFFKYQSWFEEDGECHQAKRARTISSEEGSIPEDKRGTSVKRPGKTTGPWQPRRPQTACEGCRSKK